MTSMISINDNDMIQIPDGVQFCDRLKGFLKIVT